MTSAEREVQLSQWMICSTRWSCCF